MGSGDRFVGAIIRYKECCKGGSSLPRWNWDDSLENGKNHPKTSKLRFLPVYSQKVRSYEWRDCGMWECRFSLLGGAVLLAMAGWGLLSFCKTLRKSYRAIRQKEPVSTAEIVRSLIKSNVIILLAVGAITIFTNEEMTLHTIAASFGNAIRDIGGILLLSVFCGYQVHRYNTKE